MTSKMNSPRKKLDRLADKLIDDLYETSDEEIMSEAKEDYADLNTAVSDVKNIWQFAQQAIGKRRLQTTKDSFKKERESTRKEAPSKVTDINEARLLLRNLINKTDITEKITLAARNLDDLSDQDVFNILKDLQELGAIPNGDS